jgi:predicted DNA-binding WGR domain protein
VSKLLRVGTEPNNNSGCTAKAWTVRRQGSAVHLKWGSVEVDGAGSGRRFSWAKRPREKRVRCRSEKRARAYVKRAIARRLSHKYEKLLGRVRIGYPARNR